MALKEEIEKIIHSACPDPFEILGAHVVQVGGKECVAIRAFIPEAADVAAIDTTTKEVFPMKKLHKDGFFEVIIKKITKIFPYRLKKTRANGTTSIITDPYSFLPVLSDYDLYLIGEGTHYNQYEKLGAHEMKVQDTAGVFFAVWAPNALRVSVIGGFNKWDGRRHMMRMRGSTGIWELFIPGIKEGALYKFEVKSRYKGFIGEKADPYAFYSELRPKSASVVWDLDKYRWNDSKWMKS